MNRLLFAIVVYLVCYFDVSVASSISCSATTKNKKVELKIQYDREELAVYKYDGTHLVNILLPFINVTYNGQQDKNSSPLLKTTIEGLAALTEKNTLNECDLVLRTTSIYSGDFSLSIQRDLFTTAKSCIDDKLCDQLRKITKDDVLRAGFEKYDFGENTVLFSLINERYPNIQLEKKKRSPRNLGILGKSELQSTLNAFVDFLLVGIVSYVSSSDLGRIKLPDQHEDFGSNFLTKGFFDMSDGSLGDLTEIMRTEDVKLSSDGLRYTISVGLQLPNVDINYNKYKLKHPLANKVGQATIKVQSITLNAQIIVNYNTFPCNISAGYIRSRIDGVTFELSKGNFLADRAINGIVNLTIESFARNIVDFIKNLLRTKAAEAFETLDCEKFRPRLV